jgi:hypothetical protein
MADNRISQFTESRIHCGQSFAPEGHQIFHSTPAGAHMKQLNFDHGGPDPWSTTQLILWFLAAVLAGIVFVLFLART